MASVEKCVQRISHEVVMLVSHTMLVLFVFMLIVQIKGEKLSRRRVVLFDRFSRTNLPCCFEEDAEKWR